MKYINRDFAPKDWINNEDIPAKHLIPTGLVITFGAIGALLLIGFFGG
jgi:hypothetical protein